MALTLKQTQEEELARVIRDYKEEFTERPEEYNHGDFISFLSQKIKESMTASAQGAIEATRLEYEKTRHTWKKDCDCIQCYFINGFDQAVSDQATKAKDYLGDTHD